MQPDETMFREWLEHPVTEWVQAMCGKFSRQQQARVSAIMWDAGVADQAVLNEAKIRADSYLALSEASYFDWKAIDDSEA